MGRFLKPAQTGFISTEATGSASTTGKFLTISNANGVKLGTPLTGLSASIHFRPGDSISTTYNLMVSKATSTYAYGFYMWQSSSEFRAYAIIKVTGGSGGTTAYGSWYAADGTMWSGSAWTHVVFCFDPTGASVADCWKLFVDGSKLEDNSGCSGAYAGTSITNNTGADFCIGCRSDESTYYPHDFDYKNISIWSKFLSDTRAKELQYGNPHKGEEGLIAYWPLAVDYRDRGGINNYDLTAMNSGYNPTITSNKRAQERRSFSFSTSSDWTTSASASGINAARAADDSAWNFGNADFTVEFWFAMCEMDQSTERILSVWKTSSDCSFYIDRVVYSSYGCYFKVGYSGDGSATSHPYKYQYFSSTTSPNESRKAHCVWTHFAWAFDYSGANPKAQCQFYIDGVLQNNPGNTSYEHGGSGTATGIYDGSAQLVLGNHDAGNDLAGNNFDGRICELRFWNDLRNGTEIANNYNKQVAPDAANLVGYWPGHPDADGKIKDVTSNGNDLTLDGAGVRFSTDHPFL
tara:strand:- start:820 stop:2379 length:1560 start_codon:yes stop_codon:yes gene_type:complete